ncbi:hypothetical protein BC834DRAFT_490481 [Gloeopeniophorella convolvens]|nr:hypothetical protein BC834DRAFT_490481 [Gloeopeniophorella convolvens]
MKCFARWPAAGDTRGRIGVPAAVLSVGGVLPRLLRPMGDGSTFHRRLYHIDWIPPCTYIRCAVSINYKQCLQCLIALFAFIFSDNLPRALRALSGSWELPLLVMSGSNNATNWAPTLGAILCAAVLNAYMYGTVAHQCCCYWYRRFNDSQKVKALIATLFILHTLHTIE